MSVNAIVSSPFIRKHSLCSYIIRMQRIHVVTNLTFAVVIALKQPNQPRCGYKCSNKPDRKAAGMDESSLMKAQEKMSAKSGITNQIEKTTPHLFLDELEVDVSSTIVVMIGMVWDVNSVTGHYLSTDLVICDSRGNMIHYTAKASIAHNFMRLKEGDIYSIKNFVVLPNKDEYRIFKHDNIMLEFDWETTVRKVFVNGLGFLRYPYVTDVGRTNYTKTGSKNLDFYLANQRGQSLRVTLWGGLGDALIERKIKHAGMTKKGWNYPSCGYEKCQKGVTRQNGQFICEACNKVVDYPVFRYRLEVVVANDTAHTVVVMFNDTTTELLNCSAESLLGTGENEYNGSSLPTAIRNLIGTHHVMEIKSHTYYKYGTFESFTCWKINPSEMVDDDAPSKPTEEKKKRRAELEDSDADEVSGSVKNSDKCNADGAMDKKRKMRYIMNGCESKKLLSFHHLTYTNNDGYDAQKKVTLQISPLHLRLAKKATKNAAFTSAGRAPYTFRISGQSYHRMGSLIPNEGTQPKFAQLYFFDTQNEVRNRQAAFIDKDTSDNVDQQIVRGLIQMLYHYSPITKASCMARDWCNTHNSVNFHLRLHSERKSSRQYNAPTMSEVAAVIINDFGEGLPTRDVIVNNKDSGPRRVSELHQSYMAL
ncbi:replication protein A 70 kDa DNA-binding subunit C-like protein [Tanacetum coccineum]